MATKSGRSVKHMPRSSKAPDHPHSVPVLESEDSALEQPFVEGAQDAIDPDLRHRMISEAAYHRYAERGFADGYDLDDWLQAEGEVDHLLVRPSGEELAH